MECIQVGGGCHLTPYATKLLFFRDYNAFFQGFSCASFLLLFRCVPSILQPINVSEVIRPRAHAPNQHMAIQSLQPNLKLLPSSMSTSFLILCFNSFNFTYAWLMSSNNAELVEQPGTLLLTPGSIIRNEGAVRVNSHVQNLDTSSALVSEGKSKKA
jgi:hypothetical protein